MSDAVELVLTPQGRDIGDFSVRRALPSARRRTVGPFIFFDEMGPASFRAGSGLDVRPHPHIGLATVTYLFEGEILHRDSLGTVQPIRPGDVNWMTAGRGIVHSERSPDGLRSAGHGLHGIQAWVALPLDLEHTEPAFDHTPWSELPVIRGDGVEAVVVAGAALGATSPVPVTSPTLYLDLTVQADATFELSADHVERAVYVVSGALDLGGRRIDAGALAVLVSGSPVRLRAELPTRAMVLGGEPLDGPRHMWWNLVGSQRDQVERAAADWNASIAAGFLGTRFTLPPDEHEHIRLPVIPPSGPPTADHECPTS